MKIHTKHKPLLKHSFAILSLLFLSTTAFAQAPTFTVPDNLAVSCEDADDLSVTGEPTDIEDDTDPNPVVSFTDELVASNCPGNYSIVRLWVVTDFDGNSTAGTQVIAVQDNTPPTFSIPPDIELENGENPFDLGVTGGPTELMDNCSAVMDLDLVQGDDVITNQGGCFLLIERPWQLFDECGNVAEGVQRITVLDFLELDAVSVTPPQCPSSSDGEIMIQVQSNSSYTVDWNVDTYDGQESLVDLTAGSYTVLVTNLSGCTESLTFDLEVNDESPPSFTTCPADTTILLSGASTATLYSWDLPQAVDNCTPEEQIILTSNGYNNPEGIFFLGQTTEIIYQAIDLSANVSDTCWFTVTVAEQEEIEFYVDSTDWQLDGTELRMPVKIRNGVILRGFQLELTLLPGGAVDMLRIEGVGPFTNADFQLYDAGQVGVLWFSTASVPPTTMDNDIIFYVVVDINSNLTDCLDFTWSAEVVPPLVIAEDGSEVIPELLSGVWCGTPNLEISGRITDYNGVPLANIPFDFTSNMTDVNGLYLFEDILWGGSGLIRPNYDENLLEGVNVADIITIRNHLLRTEVLSEPWQYIAADTDNSSRVSIADMVDIRNVLIGFSGAYSGVPSWQFAVTDPPLVLPIDDLDMVPTFETAYFYDNLTTDLIDQDFIGVKSGDVNGTATPNLIDNAPEDSAVTLIWTAQELGNRNNILRFRETTDNLAGYQFAVTLHPVGVWQMKENWGQIGNWYYTFDPGRSRLRCVYVQVDPNHRGSALELPFTTLGTRQQLQIELYQSLPALAATQRAVLHPLILKESDRTNVEDAATTSPNFQVFPNPVSNEFTLVFPGQEGAVMMQIFDLKGNMLMQQELLLTESNERFSFTVPNNWTSGQYTIQALGVDWMSVQQVIIH